MVNSRDFRSRRSSHESESHRGSHREAVVLAGRRENAMLGGRRGAVETCLIPIAVGGPAVAFFRRSVKTGENRNVNPGSRGFVSWITNHSRCLAEEHPSPDFRGPAAGIGGVDPNPVVVDENVPEHHRLDLRHTETVGGNPVDQFLFQSREEALHPGVVVAVRHAAQALRQTLPFKL